MRPILFHLLLKSHVQHTISLVENNHANSRGIKAFAFQMIEQTTGSAYHHLGPFTQSLSLLDRRPTIHSKLPACSPFLPIERPPRRPGPPAHGSDRQLTPRFGHSRIDPTRHGSAKAAVLPIRSGESDQVFSLNGQRNGFGLIGEGDSNPIRQLPQGENPEARVQKTRVCPWVISLPGPAGPVPGSGATIRAASSIARTKRPEPRRSLTPPKQKEQPAKPTQHKCRRLGNSDRINRFLRPHRKADKAPVGQAEQRNTSTVFHRGPRGYPKEPCDSSSFI